MKKLLKIITVMIVLLIVAAVAVPMLISADTLKTRVAAELSEATGRHIKIEGKASLQLLPDIAITLEKVTLGNPQGDFKSKRMFYAKKLETGVKLMPLLHKEIIITGVTLDGAEINLEQNASGAKNWEFTSKPSADTQQEKTGAVDKKSNLAIGEIAINDAVVNYALAGEKPIALSNIDATLSGADGRTPLALDISADYHGDKASFSLDVKDSRGFLAGKPSEVAADIDLPGGSIHFGGTAENKTELAAKGDLKLDVASLPGLLAWASGKPANPNLPKKLALQSLVNIKGKAISLGKLAGSLDDITVNGNLNANLSGAVPAVNGALHLGAIDTAKFSSKPSATGAAPAAGGEGWSSDPIDLSGLNAINANLALAIDSISMGKLQLGASNLDVNLQGGKLALGVNKLALYEGNATGNVSASSSGNFATDLNITGVQIEPLMTALNGQSRLSGTAKLALKLNGRAASQKAMAESLGGTLSFMLRDGAVKGINIAQFLRNAKQGFLLTDNKQEKTDFAEFSGSVNFVNGIGTNSDLALKAPVLRLSGNGTVNLPARSVNYRLLPTLVASAKGQDGKDKSGITIPLLVSGNWSSPKITPDFAGVIEEGLKDPAALKENLKNLKGGLKNFNSPSDIGKALLGGGTTEEAAPATAAPTDGTTAPAPAPTKAEKRQQAIEGLFKALNK